MLWNLSTSDNAQFGSALFSGSVGHYVIALDYMLVDEVFTVPGQAATSSITVHRCITSETQQSSTVKLGLLQDDQTTLISPSAKDAIGVNGLKRLESFFRLQRGWDGAASKPIDLASLEVFSRFFTETHLDREQLGVFMSARGNVVVNWPDKNGLLVELEFHPGGVEYFIESTGAEGAVTAGDIGFSKLFWLVSEGSAA